MSRKYFVFDRDSVFLGKVADSHREDIICLSAPLAAEEKIQELAADEVRGFALALQPAAGDVALLKCIAERFPASPLFFLAPTDGKFLTAEELARLPVQKILRKPLDASRFLDELSAPVRQDSAAPAVDEKSPGLALQGMRPVRAEIFLDGGLCFFDLYVKVGEDRFVKLARKGEGFDASRVRSYLGRGVGYFYLSGTEHSAYLKYCEELVLKYAQPASAQSFASPTENLLKDTFRQIRSFGVTEQSVDKARILVTQVRAMANDIAERSDGEMRDYLDKLANSDHSLATVVIVSLLLEALEFKDLELIENAGLGALLHDIGLLALPGNLADANYEDLYQNEKTDFEKHPVLGAEMLKALSLNEVIPQIILQHHERRDGKGYPNRPKSGLIHPLAEVLGLADAFQNALRFQRGKNGSPLLRVEQQHFNNYSFRTISAFRKAFFPK